MSDESVPKPGHFLPGGAGETSDETKPTRPIFAGKQPSLGRAQPLTPPPLSGTAPEMRQRSYSPSTFSASKPLASKPLESKPLGSKPLGSQPLAPAYRPGGRFTDEQPSLVSERRLSKSATAGLVILGLLVLCGGVALSAQLINSFEGIGDNPLAGPSVKVKETPPPGPEPSPTVTVTATPTPDKIRVQENGIYQAGRLASSGCKEPTQRPTSKETVLKYYQTMLPCLNESWAPIVRKAGYEFRAPKLVVFAGSNPPSSCTGDSDTAFYCGRDETISMRWQDDVSRYRQGRLYGRVNMIDTMAHEYGHHIQKLTHILAASHSREGWAKTKDAKLEENRRLELQASCFGAVYIGANKKPLEFSGPKLGEWEYQSKHSGDEYDPKHVRDHGSRKNQWRWEGPGFKTADPKVCNTFTAPAAKVS